MPRNEDALLQKCTERWYFFQPKTIPSVNTLRAKRYTPKNHKLFRTYLQDTLTARYPKLQPCHEEIFMLIIVGFKFNKERDVDNCKKSIYDGLEGFLYDDDKQIRTSTIHRAGYGYKSNWIAIYIEETKGVDDIPMGSICRAIGLLRDDGEYRSLQIKIQKRTKRSLCKTRRMDGKPVVRRFSIRKRAGVKRLVWIGNDHTSDTSPSISRGLPLA